MNRAVLGVLAALLLLSGCGKDPVADPGPAVLPDLQTPAASASPEVIDCSEAQTLSVYQRGSDVFVDVETVAVAVGEPVSVVVDTDAPLMVRTSGSTIDGLMFDPGVASMCVSFPAAGSYALEVGPYVMTDITVTGGITPDDVSAGNSAAPTANPSEPAATTTNGR